jgi:flagellar hook-length control protein FliK
MFELNSLLSGSGKSPETGVNGGMKDNSNSEKSPFGAILEANIADQEMAKSGNDAEQSGKEMPAFDYRTDLEKRTLSGGAELFLGGVEPSEEVIMDYARTQGLDAELVEILMAKSAVNKAEVVEDADTILDDLSSSGSPNTAPSSDLLSGSLSNISQNKSSLINDHSYLEVESPVTDKTKLGVSNQLGVKREDGVLTRLDTLAQKVSPDDNPEKMPLTQGNRRSAGDILTSKQNDFTANIPEELVEKLTTASSLRMHGAALVNSSSQMPSALLGENALPAKLNRAIAYTDLPSVKPQSSPVTAKNTVESTEITPLSKEIEGTSSQNNASTQESPSSRVVKSETVSVAVKNPVETAETKAPSKAVEVASPERTVSSQESPSSRVVKSEAVSVAVKNPVETAETKTPSKVAEVASPERSVSIKEGATSRVAKGDIAPTKSVAKLGSIPVTAKNSVETTEIKTPSKAVEVISPERTVSSQESASSRVVKSEPVPVAVKSPVETAETKAPSKAVEVASPERSASPQKTAVSRAVKEVPFGLDAQNKGNINSATVKARELDRAMPVSVSTLKPETTEVKPPEIKPEMRTQSDKGIDTSHKVPVGPRSVDKQTALEANANRPVPEVIRVAMPISVAKNMTSAETKNTRVIKLAPIDLAAFANTVEKVSLPYKRSSVIEENNFTKERSSEATALGTNGRVSLSEKGTTEQILNSSGQDNLRRQDQYLELSQRLTDALSRRLAAQIKQGSWHVEIELHPRSLGRIEVQLEMKNGELEAHFNASRALTRDLIQEGLPRLKAELEQHGTESAYVGVGHQNQGRSDENPTDSDGDSNSSGHETDSKADQNTKNQKVNNIEGLDIQV